MFPRKYKKLSSFKRLILKLLNVYAIDRETLNLVNPNYKNSGNNTYHINKESIILSNGFLKLDLSFFGTLITQFKLWPKFL